jgi:transcriptional regulator with XRE-family HTH domain
MFNNNFFSERLYTLRTQAKLTQKDLADSIGTTYHLIGKIEKNKSTASIEVIFAIAEYFNVSIDYLTGRTDNQGMSNIIVEQKLSEEEEKILDGYRKANILERNIIKGKLAEFEYNREVEKNIYETSNEFISVKVAEEHNR